MSRRVLTGRERTLIEAMTRVPGEATVLRRAQALLWRDEGSNSRSGRNRRTNDREEGQRQVLSGRAKAFPWEGDKNEAGK